MKRPGSRAQRRARGQADSRRMFEAIDATGQEAWIQLIDQDIHTLGEAARHDHDNFLQVVYALERTGLFEADTMIRRLAGLDTPARSKKKPNSLLCLRKRHVSKGEQNDIRPAF